MSNHYCFLCASDEGAFLDITSDNQTIFGDQLETCLTIKINENIELSNKVCYKCAYELEQCTKFVKKYKDSHKTTDSRDAQPAELSCCLCLEFADNNHIFDITKDNRAIFNPVQKIRNIFNEDVTKRESGSKLICLTCRYNLDVLYDLKKLYQEAVINLKALINKQIDYSTFPKVHTDVVNRKTTVTTFPDITFYASLVSDSEDSETMSRSKSRNKSRGRKRSNNVQSKQQNNKTKIRTCDECRSVVANSSMYRYHRTGLTVCKTCWITMDPNGNKGKRRNNAETKPCTVFLKDVLSEDSYKTERSYTIKTDEDGNRLFTITDDSSEERSSESSHLSVSSKAKYHTANNVAKTRGTKRQSSMKSDVESTPVKLTRSMTQKSTKSLRSSKERESLPEREQSPNIPVTRQARKKTNAISSDSDVLQLAPVKMRLRNSSEPSKSATSVSSTSPAESRSKKRLRSEGTTQSEHSDVSSSESNRDRKKRNASDESNKSARSEVEKREIRSRTRSSSISSAEMQESEFKSPKSMEAKLSPEVKTELTCGKCSKTFDNKISSAEHRLTHLKQITLKLERVNIDSKEKQETKTDTQEGTSREAETTDKHSDASEEIDINIDDDTDDDDDDEEIFSLSKNKKKPEENEEQKPESEESEKIDDTTEMNAAEDDRITESQNDESQKTEEESTETRGVEDVATEEPEEESTTADQSLISDEKTEEKDTKDKDERNQVIKVADDTSKSSSIDDETSEKTSKEEDITEKAATSVAPTEDDQNTENREKIETETDVEVPAERMEEQSVGECNNDAKDVQETMTRNDETVESLVDDATEDQEKNCTNESENHCRDDIHDKMGDAETARDNSKTESESNASNNERDKEEQSERKNQIMLNTAKTKVMSNDKKRSDEAAITNKVEVAKQQNGEDIIAEIMTKKLNGMDDVAKSDLPNCEKFDETADCIGNNDDDVASPANDEDTARSKTLTEKQALRDDDSRENDRLEDGINSLERLLKETATSEEYEVQENSNRAKSNSPADAASEILSEVFDLAAAEVQKREDTKVTKSLNEPETLETLENISREIRNSADMPSLDPISVVELEEDDADTEDGITLD